MSRGTVEIIGAGGSDRDALRDALLRLGRTVSPRTLDAASQGGSGLVSPVTVALVPSGPETTVRQFVEALLDATRPPAPPVGAGTSHRRLVVVRRHEGGAAAPGGDWVDVMVRQLLQARADATEEAGISTHFVRHRGPARPDTAGTDGEWAGDVAAAVDFVDRLAPRVALPELALDRGE